MAERAGNIAQHLYIRDQTIHIGGAPEWIQTLPLADLQTARDRLHSAARRHEALALLPLLLPIVIALLVASLIAAAFAGEPIEARHQAAQIALWLGGLIAVAVLFALYDVRRRHRRVVEAAERRWAELVVEIAAREDRPKREAPVLRIVRWWRSRSRRHL